MVNGKTCKITPMKELVQMTTDWEIREVTRKRQILVPKTLVEKVHIRVPVKKFKKVEIPLSRSTSEQEKEWKKMMKKRMSVIKESELTDTNNRLVDGNIPVTKSDVLMSNPPLKGYHRVTTDAEEVNSNEKANKAEILASSVSSASLSSPSSVVHSSTSSSTSYSDEDIDMTIGKNMGFLCRTTTSREVKVTRILNSSAAHRAGLCVGDVLLGVNSRPINHISVIRRVINDAGTRPLTFRVRRARNYLSIVVVHA